MHEELSSLKQRYEDVITENMSALHNTKTAAREEVKNETEEIDRRLRQANESEAKLKVSEHSDHVMYKSIQYCPKCQKLTN